MPLLIAFCNLVEILMFCQTTLIKKKTWPATPYIAQTTQIMYSNLDLRIILIYKLSKYYVYGYTSNLKSFELLRVFNQARWPGYIHMSDRI